MCDRKRKNGQVRTERVELGTKGRITKGRMTEGKMTKGRMTKGRTIKR